jgi:hypothetical protein
MTVPGGIAPAPRRFCGVGRKTAKRVPGSTRETFDEPTTQKLPARKGCPRAGDRFVEQLDRRDGIAIRVTHGGSPPLWATQAILSGRVML